MSTFFSGTDNTELQNNTPKHKMYLSLIVNYLNGGNPIARLCYKGTEKTPISSIVGNKLFNKKGKEFNDELFFEETFIYYIDLEIEFELDEKSVKRYNTLKDKQKVVGSYNNTGAFTNNVKNNYFDDFDWRSGKRWSRTEDIKHKNPQLGLFEDDDTFPTNRWNTDDPFNINGDSVEEKSDIVINEYKISKFLASILSLDYNISTTNKIENNKIILNSLDEIDEYDLKDEEQLFKNLESLCEYFAEIIFEEEVDMEVDMPLILEESIKYLSKFTKSKKAVKAFEDYNKYLLTMNNIIN